MSGLRKRIVRTVKWDLYGMNKNTVLTNFHSITTFTNIENIINKRPLTNVGGHFDELE